jgi:CheY-like chemotaxis protein
VIGGVSMNDSLLWLLVGLSLCLLAGGLGYRAFKRAAEKREREVADAAAQAEAQRKAAEDSARRTVRRVSAPQEAARRAAAADMAQAEAARAEAARLDAEQAAHAIAQSVAAEEAARAQAAQRARAQAAQDEADRLAAQEAMRVEAARRAAANAARARAAREAAEEAARSEAARVASEEAARAQAARKAAEEAARVQAARLAAEEDARARSALAVAPQAAPKDSQGRAEPKAPDQTLVMIVDDSKIVRVKTGRLLAQHQYRVAYAVDGLDAAKQIEADMPDVVITDVEMPNMDGFELTRRMRESPLTAPIPIIMITSADARHRENASRAGVNVLLGKPYPEDELIAQVRLAVEHGHARAAALA